MRGASTIAMTRKWGALRAVALGLALSALPPAAHAGMFDDEEARKQILQLRGQMADTQRALDQRVA